MEKNLQILRSCCLFVYRVFSKFGGDGRYEVLRSVRAGQVKRWCETVSSGQSQSGQSGEMSGLILCKCEFSGMCWEIPYE